MPHVTPKKRKAEVFTREEYSDDDSDVTAVEGEAIDWQDEDLVIGPTPQKNGRILGLFDNLSPEKTTASLAQESITAGEEDSSVGPSQKSRKKVNKTPLKTPSFLRKRVISVDESEDVKTPRLLFPAMPKRGLSMLISELREIEDNYEDEGMDVLREMEANFPAIIANPEEEESQEGELTSLAHQGAIENEKVKWKKKGLKRTHRRVVMRPTGKKKGPDGSENVDAAQAEGQDSDEYINSEDEAADAQAALGRPVEPTTNTPVVENTSQAVLKTVPAKKTSKAPKAGGISHNYKSLKLRNTGAKGGSRFGRGKFGGRR